MLLLGRPYFAATDIPCRHDTIQRRSNANHPWVVASSEEDSALDEKRNMTRIKRRLKRTSHFCTVPRWDADS